MIVIAYLSVRLSVTYVVKYIHASTNFFPESHITHNSFFLERARNSAIADKPRDAFVAYRCMVHTLDIAPLRSESPPQKRSGMARVVKGFHSFTCTPTFIRNRIEPYIPMSAKAL